ncbi:MAG: acyl-CoA dehydrogenase family protein [Sphingomonadales bacterium]|nr:acyl-CoA dehydrogenase family protein [Sphingomonadales bacterium]
MNFDLTEDEEMLKAMAERFVADHYDADRRRAFLAEPCGFSEANWTLLGQLGLTAALLGGPGLDLGATATATLFEALGRGLVVEPLIENVVLAARLFAATAPAGLRDAWIDGLAAGSRRIALAHAEPQSRGGRLWVETTATRTGDGILISGEKSCVPAGAGADGYIVSARHSGAPADAGGLALWLVPADAEGLATRVWRMADGGLAVSLRLEAVKLPAAFELAGGAGAIASAEIDAGLARAAETLGIMERMQAETLDYLRTREQFGARLASFQAIQHRMVAQYAMLEQARALLNLAIVSEGAPGFARAVRGLRAFLGAAALPFAHEMVQFHGGMGITNELPISHGHKRLLVLSRWPEDPDAALDAYAEG